MLEKIIRMCGLPAIEMHASQRRAVADIAFMIAIGLVSFMTLAIAVAAGRATP
ncbi:MAG: hypothetical protein ACT6Q7_01805 [Blastomonas fulva]